MTGHYADSISNSTGHILRDLVREPGRGSSDGEIGTLHNQQCLPTESLIDGPRSRLNLGDLFEESNQVSMERSHT